jgi:hypothetical protein
MIQDRDDSYPFSMREIGELMAQAATAYRLLAYARRAIISSIVGM